MRPQQGINWSSALGWLIFILVIAGGPIQSAIQSAFGVQLPGYFLPALIGGLLVLNVVGAFLGRVGTSIRTSGDTSAAPQSPNSTNGTLRRGEIIGPQFPRTGISREQIPQPRFDPIVNPLLVMAGAIGILVLGGVALLALVVTP